MIHKAPWSCLVWVMALGMCPVTEGATKSLDSPPVRAAMASAVGEVSFDNQVLPLLGRLGCNATRCHASPAGQAGFQLSMFGADPDHDYLALTRQAEGRRIDRVEPLQSLVLLKAMAAVDHGGGERLVSHSPEYTILTSWLLQGAPRVVPDQPTIQSLVISPSEIRLSEKLESADVSVTAIYSDGRRQEVTDQAEFSSSAPAVAVAEAPGVVRAQAYGQAYLIATCFRRAAVARIIVPQPTPASLVTLEPNNEIDVLVLAKLKELGIPPSPRCTDQEFLRRVYLDVIGTLPTPEEVRQFLSEPDPQRRAELVDHLLTRDEFADYWALKWGDLLRIKAEYPSNLWPNAVQAYHQWVRESIAQDKPYDQFVRELLLSSGSNFRDPPANYYRAMKKRDPQGFAETTALLFMGARIGCASCHAHPTEPWTLEDNLGMAAFFPQIQFKSTKEWKEEIVFLDGTRKLRHPQTRRDVSPKLLGAELLEIPEAADRRVALAEWLTAPENPWFARNAVNRIWYWLLGRGVVHEPDDMRVTNPASNPPLLEYLEQELIAHQFRLKSIYRLILNSATYQRSSLPERLNAEDHVFCSHYPLKRLTAEQLSDAIGSLTLQWDSFSSQIPEPYSHWPDGYRAIQMSDGSVGTPMLQLFGRPPRDTAFESDRDCRPSMRQALYLISSSEMEAKLEASPRITQWLDTGASDESIVEEAFLLALSRFPTSDEKRAAVAHLTKHVRQRTAAVQDVLWAVINTKEFLFNH